MSRFVSFTEYPYPRSGFTSGEIFFVPVKNFWPVPHVFKSRYCCNRMMRMISVVIFSSVPERCISAICIQLPGSLRDAASFTLVKRVLAVFDAVLSDGSATVDRANLNAGRIWKLCGTITREGGHIP